MEEVRGPSDPRSVADFLRHHQLFAGVPEDRLAEIARIVTDATAEQVKSSLRNVDLFEGLSDDDLLEIQRISKTLSLEDGEVLFEEGEKGDAFYVVLRGGVELLKNADSPAEQKLAVSRSGTTFGEMALLNDAPRSATARAAQQATLLAIGREEFQRLLGDGIAVRLLQGLSKALWATSVRLAAQQQKPAGDPRGVVRQVSRLIQRRLLPRSAPQVEGFQIAADAVVSEADEGRTLWDSFRLSDGRRVVGVLEVRGEGLPPGHHLALGRVLLHEIGPRSGDVAEVLAGVNDALAEIHIDDLEQRLEATLIALSEEGVEVAATGGIPVLVARSDGEVERIGPDGAPLGIEPGRTYALERPELGGGDAVFVLAGRAEDDLPGAVELAELQEEEDPARVVGRLRDDASGSVLLVRRSPGAARAQPGAGDGASQIDAEAAGDDDFISPIGDFDSIPDIPRV